MLRRHALPNAIVPTLQVIALNLAWLAGGVVVVEYLFGFPGIGSALVDSVANRDVPMVQAHRAAHRRRLRGRSTCIADILDHPRQPPTQDGSAMSDPQRVIASVETTST